MSLVELSLNDVLLQSLGYSIFTPYRGMEVKFQGVLQKEFLGVKNP